MKTGKTYIEEDGLWIACLFYLFRELKPEGCVCTVFYR